MAKDDFGGWIRKERPDGSYVIENEQSGNGFVFHADGTFEALSSDTGELLLNQYASASDAPAGSGAGIIGVTDDGHILVEDGQ